MIDDELTSAVEQAVREAVDAQVMPRWRQLAEHEVETKTGSHDLVTVADQRAEQQLSEALRQLLPGSAVVGEETVHAHPASYAALAGPDPVWIIDPIDGTRQFVAGDEGFCTMVALAHHGRTLAGWILAPALGMTALARRGHGAFLNGAALHAGSPEAGAPLHVAVSHPDYTDESQERALSGLRTDGVEVRPTGSAGLEYVAIARGRLDAVAYTWESAWDHAAGLLMVAEAGGASSTVANAPFRLEGGNALPFTAARDADTTRRMVGLLRDKSAESDRSRPA
ncbi:inositol monophosphatase [Streptomyces oryzae]|uniref:inositol-phosphate phosphatase n=1 Tax=Streptomyces oryzae TaxID=1434886 RepID=A0ABS3XLG8_9ACTN|nr:inositol monophosphatase family protein [Streptomyces oryzae]MBO8196219.1 inositol monophosphatase [Streptomyces oryzae]